MTVGEKIRAARKTAGLTQKELAEKMNISYQNLAQWETGKRNPKLENLEKIAAALEIPVEQLLPGQTTIDFSKLYRDRWGRRYDPLAALDFDPSDYKKFEIRTEQSDKALGELKQEIVDQFHREQRLLDHFHQLNPQGQEKAIEQVELVARVSEYRADQDQEDKEKRPHT